MNAGRGRSYQQSISDYVQSVRIYDGAELRVLTKEECNFSYRHSIFHEKPYLILSASFQFPELPPEESKRLQKERLTLCKTQQDNRYPNAGTTFCQANPKIMRYIMKTSSPKKGGCCFSSSKPNWLQNRGNGTYTEACKAIKKVERLHKFFHKECKIEIKLISLPSQTSL